MSFLQFFPCYKENDKLDNDLLCHPFQPCPLCDANTRHKSEIDRNMKNNSKENIWLLNANNAPNIYHNGRVYQGHYIQVFKRQKGI